MEDSIRYYWSVMKALLTIALKSALKDKLDTMLYFSFAISSITFALLFITIVFQHTNSLVGWTRADVFLLLGVNAIVLDCIYFFCGESFWQIQWQIKNGDIDFAFLLPLDSQFFLSFKYLNLGEITSFLTGVGIFIYGIHYFSFSILQFLLLIIMMLFGSLLWYGLYSIITTLSFYIGPSITIFQEPIEQLTNIPIQIFQKSIQVFMLYIIPAAFVAYIPTAVFLHKLPYWYIFIETAISIVVFFISIKLWRYSVRKYVSVG